MPPLFAILTNLGANLMLEADLIPAFWLPGCRCIPLRPELTYARSLEGCWPPWSDGILDLLVAEKISPQR
jgi:hypothetical protein